MVLLFLGLALTAHSEHPVSAHVRAAVEAAVTLPGARAEIVAVTGHPAPRCAFARAEVPRPITASGRAALHLLGKGPDESPCESWAWVQVRVKAPTLVTTRAVGQGEPLAPATAREEREISPGHPALPSLPEGATASRSIPAGTRLNDADFRVGPRLGDAVAVVIRTGALEVEQGGQAIACRRGRACALLPSGRRVEGTWHAGRIHLEKP